PPFPPPVGVNVTRPATSWNALESPAVVAGTLSLIPTFAVLCAPTVTDVRAGVTVCGLPESWAVPTVNVTLDEEKFFNDTYSVRLRFCDSSAYPKFNVAVLALPVATTWVLVAGGACTRPEPASLVL